MSLPGGVFSAAVSVAELFLAGGIISASHSPLPDHNRIYRSEVPGAALVQDLAPRGEQLVAQLDAAGWRRLHRRSRR